MAKMVIVYTSQTGFTQQYALHIAREFHCEVIDSKFITEAELAAAKVVVYGGHLWGDTVGGFARFYRRYATVLPEYLLVFGTGVMAEAQVDAARVRARSFQACAQAPQFFYFRGRVDPKTLPVRLRVMFHLTRSADNPTAAPPQIEVVKPLLRAAHKLDDLGLLN
ncbi:flavodoxin domain-containing protein [Lacticaseibacillus daqingensis]|uniref:flavodoxin domain-containing protein n=1 Tax=Lacticaseibacillus daqingensis TaxID=2486014 RepID=UPI000F7784C6|nr:flavodoxin domain-containing protein [Lacticaseibacillus daqingensis]